LLVLTTESCSLIRYWQQAKENFDVWIPMLR